MRIYLIRHGETVDNVAGLYAGSRDSALTNHGLLQATRLGNHLAQTGIRLSRIFSSNLQRAARTAEEICTAQKEKYNSESLRVKQLRELQEQDFGYYEGKPFSARRPKEASADPTVNSDVAHTKAADFKDVESKESIRQRLTLFLDDYLVPLVIEGTSEEAHKQEKGGIAIVSHGITLIHLWRSILLLADPSSVNLSPLLSNEMAERGRDVNGLEFLGGWANTGYLELLVVKAPSMSPIQRPLSGFQITVQAVNARDHLAGLKKTKGGLGSARHDDSQQKVDGFFKRRKL